MESRPCFLRADLLLLACQSMSVSYSRASCGTPEINVQRDSDVNSPDQKRHSSWEELMKETATLLDGGGDQSPNAAQDFINAERYILHRAQSESFPEELNALKNNQLISKSSKLLPLSPEYDYNLDLIRVGGRLRRAENLECDYIHPIILDPKHPITKLLIKYYEEKLHHPRPECVLAEMRRRYWILLGRQAIRQHQHQRQDCRRWSSNPVIPKMPDLPPVCLRLYKPPLGPQVWTALGLLQKNWPPHREKVGYSL